MSGWAGVSVGDPVHVRVHGLGLTECRPGLVISVGTLADPPDCRVRVFMYSSSVGTVGRDDTEATYPPTSRGTFWVNPDDSVRWADSWHPLDRCSGYPWTDER